VNIKCENKQGGEEEHQKEEKKKKQKLFGGGALILTESRGKTRSRDAGRQDEKNTNGRETVHRVKTSKMPKPAFTKVTPEA